MTKKAKIIVLSCMIALLAITAVFNFILTGENMSGKDTPASTNADYFTNFRNVRSETRSQEILQCDAIIKAAEENSTEKTEALNTKLKLTKMSEDEFYLEHMIKAQQIEECAVIMSLDSDNISIIVKTDDLTQVNAIKIYTIVSEKLNLTKENIKIQPY